MEQLSKEQVLENAHPDNSYATPPSANYQTVYKAMDLYAQQVAIAFAEWVDLNAIRQGPNEWTHKGDNWRKKRTTEEIFDLFIKEYLK